MSWALVTALCLAGAVGLLWRSPAAALRRLDGPTKQPGLVAGLRGVVGRWRGSRRKASAQLVREAPQALELLAACLSAGSPMWIAVETVADATGPATSALLGQVAAQLRVGRRASDAWRSLADHPEWGPAARDAARSAESGTSLVEGLRVHAAEARRRAAAGATKSARAVGVRSVIPLMACFLPAFVLVGVVPIIAGLVQGFFQP